MSVFVAERQTEVRTLYGAKVVLTFDAKKRRYIAVEAGQRKVVARVTSIIGYDEIELSTMLEEARRNFRQVSRRATDIGSLAHKWIARCLRETVEGVPDPGGALPLNEEARRCCRAALDWMDFEDIEPVEVERLIYSRRHGYAGTLDTIARQGGKNLVLLDWKSSSGIYPEYQIQAAAYTAAFEEETGQQLAARYIVRLPKDGIGFDPTHDVLRLSDRVDQDGDLAAFLGAKNVYDRLQQIGKNGAAE